MTSKLPVPQYITLGKKTRSKGFVLSSVMGVALVFGLLLIDTKSQVSIPSALQIDQPSKELVNHIYGKLPLAFETNRGQTNAQVKFLSRGLGYTLFLTPTEAVLALDTAHSKHGVGRGKQASKPEMASLNSTGTMRMRLVGANPDPKIEGVDQLPGKSNYFIGNDPGKWTINISQFAKVRYEKVYPGVDLLYYGNQNQLEYDFVVAPGANPEAITLAFEGAEKLEIDNQGNVVLHTKSGKVVNHIPLVYQEINGVKQTISGHYVLKGQNLIGFQLASYDPGRKVVIDPVLSYSTYLGGTERDYGGKDIAVDSAGNIYVTGFTSSTDFPTTAGAYQESSGGGGLDVFVTKINRTGSALVYSTYIGGDDWDYGNGIALDATGNVLLTGHTKSIDFPTVNAYQSSNEGDSDVFVLELNSEGTGLIYSTYLGGQSLDAGIGIATDPSGNIYVTGNTSSSDFPTTPGVLIPTSNSGALTEAFVTKVNPAKTGQESLVYSTYLTNVTFGLMGYSVYGSGIAADRLGNAYVTGSTDSWYFPTSLDAFQTTIGSASTRDAFVTKMSPDGTFFWYSTYLGGNGGDAGKGITVDSSGNAYVTGSTSSTNFPMKNPLQSSIRGGGDVFVTKLNPSGSALIYSTYLGGNYGEIGYGIAVDATGNAHLTGSTNSDDFPVVNSFQNMIGGGSKDAFTTIISSDGSKLLYSTYLGGNGDDVGNAIVIDRAGNVYVAGETTSADFPTVNAFQNTLKGPVDAFVVKIRTSNAMPWIPLLLIED